MKDNRAPYFLNNSTTLLDAVKEYCEQHVSVDLDFMTEYIIDNYDEFGDKNKALFKSSVKKAFRYVAKTRKVDPVKEEISSPRISSNPRTPPRGNATNGRSYSRCNAKNCDCNPWRFNTATPCKCQSEVEDQKKKKAIIKSKSKKNFFHIDTEGDSKDVEVDCVEISDDEPEMPQLITPKPLCKGKKILQPSALTIKTPQSKRKTLDENIESTILKKRAKLEMMELLNSATAEKVTFADLGGLDGQVQKSVLFMLRLLEEDPSTRLPVTLLLTGPPGAGKTALITAMATASQLPVTQVRLGDLMAGLPVSPEKKVWDEICGGLSTRPVFLWISQMDRLCRDGGSGSSGRQADKDAVADMLYQTLFRVVPALQGSKVMIVAECSHVEHLDRELVNSFDHRIAIRPPTAHQRTQMLQRLCTRASNTIAADVDFEAVGLKCSGFVAGDLVRLLKEAARVARLRSLADSLSQSLTEYTVCPGVQFQAPLIQQDFCEAIKAVSPVLKREGFPTIPDTTWDDVGGLEDIREELRVKMIDPIKMPELMANYNKRSSGILLWGPPGCGKTLLAKAVANEAGVNLLIVNGPDLLSMYQGESERAVRVLFARAASVAPCVIFFDEFDSLCPRRSKTGSESGSKSTIVNTLLTEMSGFVERSGVYVMAATNLPAILDPAVLRPGRFDTLLYVGLPDLAGRVAVLNAATKHGTLPGLASDVDLQHIASKCENFSGADCRNLVSVASDASIEEVKGWWRHTAEADKQMSKRAASTSDALDVNTAFAELSTGAPAADEQSDASTVIYAGQAANETETDEEWEDMDDESVLSEESPVHCTEDIVDVMDTNQSVDGQLQKADPGCSEEKVAAVPSVVSDASKGYKDNPLTEGEYLLYARHFDIALNKVKPSVSKNERLKYEEQQRKDFIGR